MAVLGSSSLGRLEINMFSWILAKVLFEIIELMMLWINKVGGIYVVENGQNPLGYAGVPQRRIAKPVCDHVRRLVECLGVACTDRGLR